MFSQPAGGANPSTTPSIAPQNRFLRAGDTVVWLHMCQTASIAHGHRNAKILVMSWRDTGRNWMNQGFKRYQELSQVQFE